MHGGKGDGVQTPEQIVLEMKADLVIMALLKNVLQNEPLLVRAAQQDPEILALEFLRVRSLAKAQEFLQDKPELAKRMEMIEKNPKAALQILQELQAQQVPPVRASNVSTTPLQNNIPKKQPTQPTMNDVLMASFKAAVKPALKASLKAALCSFVAFPIARSYKEPLVLAAGVFSTSLCACCIIKRDPDTSALFASGACALVSLIDHMPVSITAKIVIGIGVLGAYSGFCMWELREKKSFIPFTPSALTDAGLDVD